MTSNEENMDMDLDISEGKQMETSQTSEHGGTPSSNHYRTSQIHLRRLHGPGMDDLEISDHEEGNDAGETIGTPGRIMKTRQGKVLITEERKPKSIKEPKVVTPKVPKLPKIRNTDFLHDRSRGPIVKEIPWLVIKYDNVDNWKY